MNNPMIPVKKAKAPDVELTISGTVTCDDKTLPADGQWRWFEDVTIEPACSCDGMPINKQCHHCWLDDFVSDSGAIQKLLDASPVGSTLTIVGFMRAGSLGWYDDCEEFEEWFEVTSYDAVTP